MCGIVGYWGPDNPKKVILEGLKRLEYRGYDSAGVAIFRDGQLKLFRSAGKLSKLEAKIASEDFTGPSGIGHTRWATHGEPNETNAHPHQVGRLALIHNGIIENDRELRAELKARGIKPVSQTDSEVVAHLIDAEMTSGTSLLNAAVHVIPKLRGAYSILIISETNPDQLLAFKNGPPMLVGLGDKEVIIASDIHAFIGRTQRVIFLEDGEIVVSDKAKVRVFNATGEEIKKIVHDVAWTAAEAEKAGYPHFMLKEIFEQPRAVVQTMDAHIQRNPLQVKLHGDVGLDDEHLRSFKRFQILACGTSWHAALIGKYAIEKLARIPVDVEIASEFRYRDPILNKDTLSIFISQSGETADTLACLRHCLQHGLKTLSICNVQHSSINREAHYHLPLQAGPEIGVCSTKAFSAQVVALELLALALARVHKALSADEMAAHVQSLLALPSQIEVCLNHNKWFKEAAESFSRFKGFLYLGRGICYPVALEGALKLKEVTYVPAEGYPSGELKHGPIAMVDEDMAVIAMAPRDELYEKNYSNIQEVRARGGHIISIGTGEDQGLQEISRHYLPLPAGAWLTNPILTAIPVQLLSYHIAVVLKRDVDQPRNLAKSVTVE